MTVVADAGGLLCVKAVLLFGSGVNQLAQPPPELA